MSPQQDVAEKITTVIVESDEDLGNLNDEQEKGSKNEKEFERKTYPNYCHSSNRSWSINLLSQ